jgi:hypothetical protein
MSSLEHYWPSQAEVVRCIKTEAETASDAVLLAVHQETPLAYKDAGSENEKDTDEAKLLDAFLTEDMPSGTLLLAVTGRSGVGKSHIIRWLAAQLGRDTRAKDMHVIRIPKTANLRAVVEAILEPLAGIEKYTETRKELQKAVSAVRPEDGAIRFSGELQIALKDKAASLEGIIRSNLQAQNVVELKAQLDHAKRLPDYFQDATLKDYFLSDIFPKIVEQAIQGRHEEDDEEFGLPQFSVDDLKLPENIALGDAAIGVRGYYQTVLNKDGGNGFELAVEVLNGVVDEAIRCVFRLDQALGGKTIEEVILDIRDILLVDGKELVLLIEDFAALSGIQEVLLSVCIHEAVRNGELVRAPMRTAIAVTDGFLTNRDTILTRAKGEWIVRSSLPNEEIFLERTTSLVGAYLNAARWGEDALIANYKASQTDNTVELLDWIEPFVYENETPEEDELRVNFGQSKNGFSLFPFNRNAIDSLARIHLQEGERLYYNPRLIINKIIKDTLKYREMYLNGIFPPTDFSGLNPQVDIAEWLHQIQVPGDDRERLAKLIVHWGGNPVDRKSLGALPDGLFKCFKLPTPTSLGIEPTRSRGSGLGGKTGPSGGGKTGPSGGGKTGPSGGGKTGPEPFVDPIADEWKPILEEWVEGTRLTQSQANQIRNAISSALHRGVDWVALCMKPVKKNSVHIQLPGAGEGSQTSRSLTFAPNTNDADGRLRRTVLAFVRYQNKQETWNYLGADQDTALIANAVDQLMPAYISLVTSEAQENIGDLTEALTRQGHLLGVAPKQVSSLSSISSAVFSDAPELDHAMFDEGSPADNWAKIRKASITQRKGLQDLLRTKIAAFQGAGNIPFAIDVARLELGSTENFDALKIIDADQKTHLRDLRSNRLMARARPLMEVLQRFRLNFESLIGAEFDKDEISANLKGLIISAEEGNAWPGGGYFKKQSLLDEVEVFRASAIGELMKQLADLGSKSGSSNIEDVLFILGKIDLSLVERIEKFLNSLTRFVDDVETEVKQQEGNFSGIDVEKVTAAIRGQIDGLEETLAYLGGIPYSS